MKKKFLCSMFCFFVTFSMISVTAFACYQCKNDSTPVNGVGTISATNVNLRSCHYTSSTSHGQLTYGDTGNITHVHPTPYAEDTWVRIEMTSGNHKGNNGWVGGSLVTFYLI